MMTALLITLTAAASRYRRRGPAPARPSTKPASVGRWTARVRTSGTVIAAPSPAADGSGRRDRAQVTERRRPGCLVIAAGSASRTAPRSPPHRVPGSAPPRPARMDGPAARPVPPAGPCSTAASTDQAARSAP